MCVCTVHTRMYLDSHCIFYAMELFTLSMTEQMTLPCAARWAQLGASSDELRISDSL